MDSPNVELGEEKIKVAQSGIVEQQVFEDSSDPSIDRRKNKQVGVGKIASWGDLINGLD